MSEPDPRVRYARDGRLVMLDGIAAVPPEVSDPLGIRIFTLPEGYRPASELQFRVETSDGEGIVTVAPDGSVLATPAEWVDLSKITFEAAPEG
jgi:hypothetical protein